MRAHKEIPGNHLSGLESLNKHRQDPTQKQYGYLQSDLINKMALDLEENEKLIKMLEAITDGLKA